MRELFSLLTFTMGLSTPFTFNPMCMLSWTKPNQPHQLAALLKEPEKWKGTIRTVLEHWEFQCISPSPSLYRLKIEELEAERGRLEEENKSLEMKLEKLTLQGDYDRSKTKVLHFSMNPASLAKQQRKEEQHQLQEECERLRELVRVLEGGGSIPGNLEMVGSLQSPQEVAELKKQVESAELKNQRLKEVFQTKIQEFRKVCYTLTGYQIDITTENQYRLTSIYAEHQGDCLLFKASSSSGGKMQLLETEFSLTIRELIDLHLLHQDSIPAFLSAVTLELFSHQTCA
uniref:Mitotic spindle assembly checkpoint protein MAD1 n=1 Tax=Gopherus agassizii TaxID=38772 RepID=A0A452GXA3_9SAUR